MPGLMSDAYNRWAQQTHRASRIYVSCIIAVSTTSRLSKAPISQKGIYSEPEFERLRAELERVEKEENILCVSNYIFSAWVVKR